LSDSQEDGCLNEFLFCIFLVVRDRQKLLVDLVRFFEAGVASSIKESVRRFGFILELFKLERLEFDFLLGCTGGQNNRKENNKEAFYDSIFLLHSFFILLCPSHLPLRYFFQFA
jgi:hypothetical protein